ncbi:drug resistance transporter, EmrB/QacA subfamily [Thermodesulfatator indicus DSM 15286]|uniref:Drug resistance transporter, EmrB/QacA subfamily n=1 Tax=Thermodesulfatator indicus (strain DSM 15286 / JCM 11887 / CIR29812) TaxID=667014 RepID=F8ACT6_THEID|nr:DHA2 family efflux MFS transporter permease subunit [Thermodesulfatator indicus]AEH44727.1 drug resistance transporter, EmrB/QacA subfamily [Thermodesulfatator indicus DSM 15286]
MTPSYKEITPAERVLITIIVMVGAFIAILDTTIVDIVVPKMMAPLSTDLYGIQWVITSYMTAAAVGLLLVASLGKSYGFSKIFTVGVAIFTISSAACGGATSLAEMIVFRSLQGIGEAFIMGSAQTILFSAYPPERHGLAMGIFSLGVSFAPALGPTAGGFLTEHFSWRYVFLINVPIGTLNFIAALFFLRELVPYTKKLVFNFRSYILLATASISLLIMLSKGQQYGWFQSTFIGVLAFVSAISLCLYFLSEIKSKTPLIDFSIYKIPEFGLTMGFHFFVLGFAMYQIFYLLPLYYERLKGLPTFDTGLHMLAFAGFIGIFSIISGILSDKISPVKILFVSFVLLCICSLFLLPKLNYWLPAKEAAILTIPFGIAMGTFFAPMAALALRPLGDKAGLGVAQMNYQRFIAGSFGTAIATNTLEKRASFHFQEADSLQNFNYAHMFLEKITHKLSAIFPEPLATLKAKVLIYKWQELMAYSLAFQDTFRYTFYYAALGGLFLLALAYQQKFYRRPA